MRFLILRASLNENFLYQCGRSLHRTHVMIKQ